MKATAPTAIALTLLMFVIVLAATVFFLFQNQQTLNRNLENAGTEIRTLEQQQAEIELNNAAAKSTYEVLEASSTTAAAENAQMAEELVELDQDGLTRDARESQLSLDQENANATVQAYESLGPLIKLVEPDKELIAGQPIELVIVASDHTGVTSIDFTIGNEPELYGGPTENNQPTEIMRKEWTPGNEGSIEIAVTATNLSGITSNEIVRLVVINPPATTEPTVEATLEPTIEPTSTSESP